MNLKFKVLGVVVVAAALSVCGTQLANANGTANSTDSNHGAQTQFTAVNEHITAYDNAYDGWGALTRMAYNIAGGGGGDVIDEKGYNTSFTVLVVKGYPILYHSCLEHNLAATTAYCGGDTSDHS